MVCCTRVPTYLIVIFYFIIEFPFLSHQNAIYLYNTEDNNGVEYYDCITVDAVPYCRRPEFPIDLHRDDDELKCLNDGTKMNFDVLRTQSRTPSDIVHGFRSSMEKAEEYARYLAGDANSSTLCLCKNRTYGKTCQYRLFENWLNTFEASQKHQNKERLKNRFDIHAHQKTLCYNTLTCDSGLLCLDWRDICDGRQQCMNGTDEEACDLLEFNECEGNEYRCSNGMCIPDIYFLDGEYDCMDYSDEQRPFDHSTCGYEPDPYNCDEHLCAVSEWSCGDGQCIDETNRYEWQKVSTNIITQCYSMREYMYMCELGNDLRLWTSIMSGTCRKAPAKGSIDEEWNEYDHTILENCQYLVKCALSGGLDKRCPCKNSTCDAYIANKCSSAIPYPSKGLLTPYLVSYYENNRKWSESKQPDFYTMSGSIKCAGYHAQTRMNESIWVDQANDKRHIVLADKFCQHYAIVKHMHGPHFHRSCYANMTRSLGANLSYAFVNVCNQCISQYRINDGMRDCLNGEDEQSQQINTCTSRVRHHRYRCRGALDTCLVVKTLGDSFPYCNGSDDEFAHESGRTLFTMMCGQLDDDDCRFLREYLRTSGSNTSSSLQMTTNAKISFRSYCNTFWDLLDRSDELKETCQSWKCGEYEFQCNSGQCISDNDVCDNEWDCSDASDELIDLDRLTAKNKDAYVRKNKTCGTKVSNGDYASKNRCNPTTEYPCLLANYTRDSNMLGIRHCIHWSQIGDNTVDCLGGLDERNTLMHCHEVHQLGFAFQCQSTPNECLDEQTVCLKQRCPKKIDDSLLCADRTSHNCSEAVDFPCIDGTCVKNARCNGKIECDYGEDEYYCDSFKTLTAASQYRSSKRQIRLGKDIYLTLPTYPSTTHTTKTTLTDEQKTIVKQSISTEAPSAVKSLICNRGIAVLDSTGTVVCLCPPSYYGELCEYHSDRITSYVHLNASNYPYTSALVDKNMTIKVLTLLKKGNRVIHIRQFHFRSVADFNRIAKKKEYLLYSRSEELLEEKIRRQSNRTSIVDHTPYYLQYEAYELYTNMTIHLIGVWKYPIFFDFLPSFRFSKVLHFHNHHSDSFRSPCHSNPCHSSNADCQILQNDPTKYVCLCKPDYSGDDCSIRDQHCANNFCSSQSLCKPTYSGIKAGDRLPYCVCPLQAYGKRCGLIFDQCKNDSCKNNGICYPDRADPSKVICGCQNDFYGPQCQSHTGKIDLIVHTNNVSGVTLVQYLRIDKKTLNLALAHQNVSEQPPNHLLYRDRSTSVPEIVLLKNYPTVSSEYPHIFVASLAFKSRSLVSTAVTLTDNNLCSNVKELVGSTTVYRYHEICRYNSSIFRPLCFFDKDYLCFCENERDRAECFGYEHSLDQCSQCLSGGRCVRGDLRKADEFLCVCPKCHYGHQCQYSSERFSFTLEQIYTLDVISMVTGKKQVSYYVIILVVCLCFTIGAVNNLFTFVTFHRSKFLRSGVGNYLLVGSVINQLALLFLGLRLLSITLTRAGDMSAVNLLSHNILCKSLAYASISSSQLSYWIMSAIAVERFYITWNVKGTWFKKAFVARRIMLIFTILVLLISAPLIAFYKSLVNAKAKTRTVMCVLVYTHSFWTRLNQVNSYVNNLLPLIVNISCTAGIMVLITRQKLLSSKKSDSPVASTDVQAKPDRNKDEHTDDKDLERTWRMAMKKQWHFFRTVIQENIELIFGPTITIVPQLFCLPQLILASTMDCQDLSTSNVKYALIVSFIVSYIPQMTSFLLYVRSSSVYYAHFRSTSFSKRMMLFWCCCCGKVKQQSSCSHPSRCLLSNTLKLENLTDKLSYNQTDKNKQ